MSVLTVAMITVTTSIRFLLFRIAVAVVIKCLLEPSWDPCQDLETF